MCGRFAQAQTREEYLVYLAEEAERDDQLHLDPVI
jgi:putative SOS response-associated peptidase YedK